MTEEEYLELMDEDPDQALEWMYQSRFVFFTMGDGIAGFDGDLVEDFLEKLIQNLSLTPSHVIELLNDSEVEGDELRKTIEELGIRVRLNDGKVEQASIWMNWESADPWTTVEWLGQLGYIVEFYGGYGSSMGQVGAWFIRSECMLENK